MRHWSVVVRRWLDSPFCTRSPLFWPFFPLLLFPSMLWAAVARRRRRQGYRDFLAGSWPRVWCVGNVALGGSGKSPVVRAVAQEALMRGFRVAIVSRGSGKAAFPIQASQGFSPQLASALAKRIVATPAAHLCDEAHEHFKLLKWFCPNASIVVIESRRRRFALDSLREALLEVGEPLEKWLILLDDGMQHFDAPRHGNISVLNPNLMATAPFCCPPLGPFREGFFNTMGPLLAGDFLRVWSRTHAGGEAVFAADVAKACRRLEIPLSPEEVCVRARLAFHEIVEGVPGEPLCADALRGPLTVVTGIADGEGFACDIAQTLGLERKTISLAEFEDHGALTGAAAAFLAAGEVLLLTGKDYFRWSHTAPFRAAASGKRVVVAILHVDFFSACGTPLSLFERSLHAFRHPS